MNRAVVGMILLLTLGIFANGAFLPKKETSSGALLLTFEDVKPGNIPSGWKVEATHPRGELSTWEVEVDSTAPSGKHVLSLTDPKKNSGGTFNLCWTDRVRFLNGKIEVKFRANTGREDQGGGVIWRAKDRNNYYIARMNPLESNFRIYYVKDGRRVMLASARIRIPAGEWHTLAISHHGDDIAGFIDGRKLLEVRDATFSQPGGVGLWTKADAATSFDDFLVQKEK